MRRFAIRREAQRLYSAAAQDFAAGRSVCDRHNNPLSHDEEQRRLDDRLAYLRHSGKRAACDSARPASQGRYRARKSILGRREGGGATIGHEWFAYKDGEWHDRDCHALSVAKWVLAEGYGGDLIHLPNGAIGQVIQPLM